MVDIILHGRIYLIIRGTMSASFHFRSVSVVWFMILFFIVRQMLRLDLGISILIVRSNRLYIVTGIVFKKYF